MKKITLLSLLAIGLATMIWACGSTPTETPGSTDEPAKSMLKTADEYDPNRGEGKFNAENLQITEGIDAAMAAKGKAISETKCASCHKLTEEKLVGPGWKGVTQRRTPYWIMNFITNPDGMIDKDPELQAQLEICLVRMPNQNIAEEEARQVLEYLRSNDSQ